MQYAMQQNRGFLFQVMISLVIHWMEEIILNCWMCFEIMIFFDSHLNTSGMFQGTCPTVQNDIQAICNVKDHTNREISKICYHHIWWNFWCYVKITALNSFLFCSWRMIQERFFRFTNITADRMSVGLFNHSVNTVKEF